MSRPVKPKRGARKIDRVAYNDVTYFIYGFSFLNPYDPKGIPEKWEYCRESFMEKWMTFKPFEYIGKTWDQNEPGKRPWAWWNLDHPDYRRKHLEGKPGEGGEHNNGIPRYYRGSCKYETQAAFLRRMGLLTPQEIEFFEVNEMETEYKI